MTTGIPGARRSVEGAVARRNRHFALDEMRSWHAAVDLDQYFAASSILIILRTFMGIFTHRFSMHPSGDQAPLGWNAKGLAVLRKMALTLFAAALLVAVNLFAPCTPRAAQVAPATGTDFSAQRQQGKKHQKRKAAPARRSAPRAARHHRAAPRAARQHNKATPRAARQRKATPGAARHQKATPRVTRHRKARSPAAARRGVKRRGSRAVTASRIRGVPARGTRRAVIRGRNYSAWRSGHRVRHGSGWRTFGALSVLGAILVGSNEYYPYAYISAPESYCEGLTEDGCELVWQQVETVEGDVVDQCVAYCPWR